MCWNWVVFTIIQLLNGTMQSGRLQLIVHSNTSCNCMARLPGTGMPVTHNLHLPPPTSLRAIYNRPKLYFQSRALFTRQSIGVTPVTITGELGLGWGSAHCCRTLYVNRTVDYALGLHTSTHRDHGKVVVNCYPYTSASAFAHLCLQRFVIARAPAVRALQAVASVGLAICYHK